MKILRYTTDTHSLVWAVKDDKRLGKNAASIFKKADKGKTKIIIPPIVPLECIVIAQRKELGMPFPEFYRLILSHPFYQTYPLDQLMVYKVFELTGFRDLHDRVIVATALLSQSKLITKDKKIKDSKLVEVIW